MTTQAMTIGGTGTRRRASLEELVDRLMAALFRDEPETAQRQRRAWPGASTTHGVCGRRETSTGRWRSWAAWTRRRRRRKRRSGPTPSGWTWRGGGSATARPWSTARAGDGPLRSLPVTTARWRSPRSWGCGGGPARSSRSAASGGSGPWRRLALGPDRRVARRWRSASNG